MSRNTEYNLRTGLVDLGFKDHERIASSLERFGRSLIAANAQTNLVGAKSFDDLVGAHFLDSLAAVKSLPLASPVVDVGSGAGLPGIPIALAWPSTRVVLLEPRKKRAAFLTSVIRELDLRNVTVEQVTAETAGRASWRGKAGSALIRAVARPLVALELGLPLLRRGGRLVLYTGKAAYPSAAELVVAGMLGGSLESANPVEVPFVSGERHAWVLVKTGDTPAGYPRRSGLPGKEPLGGE